jgi:DNA-binding response OmpR family regulator
MLGDCHGLRVLVVDDEPMVLRMVATMLEHAGCTVRAIDRPIDALAAIREHPELIDLVLTDVVMPGMSGVELAARAREISPRLPLLFMSGFTGVATPDGPLVAKPFKSADLLATIESVIRASRKPTRREEAGGASPSASRSA